MLETFIQYTCDGCGETGWTDFPDVTRAELRAYLRTYGWRNYDGQLDYCPQCVANGAVHRRDTLFGKCPKRSKPRPRNKRCKR